MAKKDIVLAYRSDWNEKVLPPDRIDWEPLTHIAHSFAVARASGLRFPETVASRALVKAAHHVPLFAPKNADPSLCAAAAIRYWREKKRFPASKLLLGIPLYVRGFRAKNWNDPVPNSADNQFSVAYRTLKGAGTTDKAAVCATWLTENFDALFHMSSSDVSRRTTSTTR